MIAFGGGIKEKQNDTHGGRTDDEDEEELLLLLLEPEEEEEEELELLELLSLSLSASPCRRAAACLFVLVLCVRLMDRHTPMHLCHDILLTCACSTRRFWKSLRCCRSPSVSPPAVFVV
jgi:hypothetical protein